MPLTFERKQQVVAELSRELQQAQAGLVADYRGLTVSDMEKLREMARESDVYVSVVKNTLAKRAIEDTEFKCLESLFSGPVLVALSRQEPNAAAKIARQFRKQNEKLEVKGLALNGALYSADDLERVADLPTKDEARAQLLGVMKAPMTQLVRTMAEPPTRLARVVSAIRDKKQAA